MVGVLPVTSVDPNRQERRDVDRRTGVLNLNNFRNRVWTPAIQASGVRKPARIYDLGSTFASNALAAGITVCELAPITGTSVEMIERRYGAPLDGSGASMTSRLAVFEAEQDRAADWASTEG